MERSVTMMLQLQNVSKEFGSGKSRVRTLQDINFEVNDWGDCGHPWTLRLRQDDAPQNNRWLGETE